MLYSEFLKGTRAPETPDTYDQFQIIGQIYEDCEGMTKEEAYRIWKQTYGRELKRRELRQRERLELLIKSNIDARVEWLRWQALGNGAMIYDKSGIKLGVDFGVPEVNKVTAATAWGTDGATILANYERWVQDYIDGNDNGYAPDVFVTGIENIRIVLNDVAIRKAITGYSDKLLTLDELNTFLRGRELPPMEAFDAKVTYRDPTNGGKRTTARLLDSKKGVFLMEGDKIGNVQMGPTYENNMEPGIFARTFTMERPLREVVEVVAAGFPKIMYPELIKICTVR